MKRQVIFLPLLVFSYSYISILPAKAGFWDKVGDYINNAGDKIAKVADVTDKNSDARRILRNMDIANPNSPACNSLRNGGDDASAAAASTGPKGMAVATAITTAKKICGNAAAGKPINSDQAEIDMAVMYQTQLAIEKAKQNGQTERVKVLENSKIKLEELQQKGDTERTRIVQENLLAITLSNNQKDIILGEQNLRAIESNNWTALEQVKTITWGNIATVGLSTLGDIIKSRNQTSSQNEIEKRRAENEAKRIENETKKIENDRQIRMQEIELEKIRIQQQRWQK